MANSCPGDAQHPGQRGLAASFGDCVLKSIVSEDYYWKRDRLHRRIV